MLKLIYSIVAALLLSLYSASSLLGWELGGYTRESAEQAAARQAAGGHRATTSWWYFGFRGGK